MFINQVKKQDIASIPESSQRVLFEHKPSSPRRKYLIWYSLPCISWYFCHLCMLPNDIVQFCLFPNYINGIILYISTWVLFPSISIMLVGFINNDMLLYVTEMYTFSLHVVFHCTNRSQFIHYTVEPTLHHFHFGILVNNAFMNILIQISWLICAPVSLGYKPGVELLGHRLCIFSTLLIMSIISQSRCTNLYSYQ